MQYLFLIILLISTIVLILRNKHINQLIKENSQKLNFIQVENEKANDELKQVQEDIKKKTQQNEQLDIEFKNKKETFQKSLDLIQDNFEKLKAERQMMFLDEISKIEEQNKLCIQEKINLSQQLVDSYNKNLQEEKKKYISTMKILQEEISQLKDKTIQLTENDKRDIAFLLENINKISKTDTLYKLIWTEYIQNPTNQMLNAVLKNKDCAGIYKITNLKDQKSYIGRSTSVRKRLIEHIKGSIGISKIADQYVHQVMREQGLWNFSFELIEECDKSLLSEREKYYIKFFETETFGYNRKAGG